MVRGGAGRGGVTEESQVKQTALWYSHEASLQNAAGERFRAAKSVTIYWQNETETAWNRFNLNMCDIFYCTQSGVEILCILCIMLYSSSALNVTRQRSFVRCDRRGWPSCLYWTSDFSWSARGEGCLIFAHVIIHWMVSSDDGIKKSAGQRRMDGVYVESEMEVGNIYAVNRVDARRRSSETSGVFVSCEHRSCDPRSVTMF